MSYALFNTLAELTSWSAALSFLIADRASVLLIFIYKLLTKIKLNVFLILAFLKYNCL